MKSLILFAGLLLAAGCTKQGPAGIQGPAGAQGTPGPQGPQGPQGNADVMVDTFSLTSSQYAWNSFYYFAVSGNSADFFFTRYHDCPFPAVTADALASGMVLAYFVPDTAYNIDQWAPLPYSYLNYTGDFYYNIAFETKVGSVRIHYFYSPNGKTGTVPTTLSTDVIPTHRYKLVAVSGKIADAMRRAKVDLADENAVSRFLLQ